MLHQGFPDADHAPANGILWVTHAVAPVRRQPRISADEPEEHVRIKEESHAPSNAFQRSSGRSASKSSGTTNSPAHNPHGRNVLAWVTTGLTSATGCPARIITNVSPASTRLR